MKRKLAAALLVCPLTWAACTHAGPVPAPLVELGQSFSLRVGESARTAGSLQVGFESVSNDSRCPKGVQCVWAGDAILKVWLQQGSGPRTAHELHAGPGFSPSVVALGHELRLVRLEPFPVANRVIVQSDYVATLSLQHSAPAAPER